MSLARPRRALSRHPGRAHAASAGGGGAEVSDFAQRASTTSLQAPRGHHAAAGASPSKASRVGILAGSRPVPLVGLPSRGRRLRAASSRSELRFFEGSSRPARRRRSLARPWRALRRHPRRAHAASAGGGCAEVSDFAQRASAASAELTDATPIGGGGMSSTQHVLTHRPP